MAKSKRKPLSEEEILRQVRETYSREQCIQFWYDVREGVRKEFPKGFRQKHAHRKYVIEAFVEEFKKKNKTRTKKTRVLEDIIKDDKNKYEVIVNKIEDVPILYPEISDFDENKLAGLLEFYSRSPYDALVDAGFTNPESENYDPVLDKSPWLATYRLPNKYWQIKKNKIKAVKWLVENLNKPIAEIKSKDFEENGLSGLLQVAYKGCPYLALKEVYPKLKPTDMHEVPGFYWRSEQNRLKHIKQLVKKLNKPITEITNEDFFNNGLSTILTNYYGSSVSRALKKAFPNFKISNMRRVPNNFWKDEKNFRRAILEIIKENNGKLPNSQELRDNHPRISHVIYRYPELYGSHKVVKRKYERIAARS